MAVFISPRKEKQSEDNVLIFPLSNFLVPIYSVPVYPLFSPLTMKEPFGLCLGPVSSLVSLIPIPSCLFKTISYVTVLSLSCTIHFCICWFIPIRNKYALTVSCSQSSFSKRLQFNFTYRGRGWYFSQHFYMFLHISHPQFEWGQYH